MAITDAEWKRLEELLDRKLEEKLEEKLSASEKKIYMEIGDFITQNLIPLIEEKADKADLVRIERKLDKAIDKLYGHEERILDIESVPVVAHYISTKKSHRKGSD